MRPEIILAEAFGLVKSEIHGDQVHFVFDNVEDLCTFARRIITRHELERERKRRATA